MALNSNRRLVRFPQGSEIFAALACPNPASSTPAVTVMRVTTLAGSGDMGSTDGTGTAASFDNPTGVAVDSSGNVYVADASNCLIRKIQP